jgi:hypothetical protein
LSYAHAFYASTAASATGADDTSSGPGSHFEPRRSNATSLAGIYDYLESLILADLADMVFLAVFEPEFRSGSSYCHAYIHRLARLFSSETTGTIHHSNELRFL